jgi:serine phosphatase RsbU (regulator of sigma subunit)
MKPCAGLRDGRRKGATRVLQVEIAVAKAPKYAVPESGDTVEVIERPRGGLSVVMVDGQRSGRSAKAISNLAVRKAVSLLAEGVRDGAVARAAHDYLRTQRGGQVSAELTILSIDLETCTLVVSRNSRCPVLVSERRTGVEAPPAWNVLAEPAEPLGVHARARPVILEVGLEAEQTIIAFTDGLLNAGSRRGAALDPIELVSRLGCPPRCPAAQVADALLLAALGLDENRLVDDVSVVVVQVLERASDEGAEIRRMTVSFPVSPT